MCVVQSSIAYSTGLNNINVMVKMTFCSFVITQEGHWVCHRHHHGRESSKVNL